jgi:hypothetical protein
MTDLVTVNNTELNFNEIYQLGLKTEPKFLNPSTKRITHIDINLYNS